MDRQTDGPTDGPTKRLIESRARDYKEKRAEKEEEEKFVDLVDLPTFKSLFARNVNPSIAFECRFILRLIPSDGV